jgi:CubicO group peptidase (beta-lactamase class C family)
MRTEVTDIDARIAAVCTQAIAEAVFPGCSVGYVHQGKRRLLSFGHTRYSGELVPVTPDTVYDVASVTKSVPTACIVMNLIEEGRLSLDDRVVDYIPELQNEYRDEILVRHLLTYTVVFDIPGGFSKLALDWPERVLQQLGKVRLAAKPGTTYYYTNPPAYLLGLICERIVGQRLDAIADARYFRPLGMKHTSFLGRTRKYITFAPSEIDWRGELRGKVHDESAWILAKAGQVTGHAGLFTSAADLLRFASMLLAQGTIDGHTYLQPQSVTLMHTNQLGHLGHHAGMGWQMGQPQFMGTKGSDELFGKTGYRSSVILVDPKREAALVHLSNGNYPHRPARDEPILAVRRALADIIFAA